MSASSPAVTVRVPAKVNLHLGVGPTRPDGYHELVTVFHAVDLYDLVTVRPGPELAVRMRGTGADELPAGPANLAWRAAEALAAQLGRDAAVQIEIVKAIPVAGGMAGGSADAAATLRGCAALWGTDPGVLPAVAAGLGSDVPFALLGGTALGTGRGEVLEPLPSPAELHWAIATAGFGISTAAAYAELDRLRAAGATAAPALDAGRLRAALAGHDLGAIASALHNDLQSAALSLAPPLGDVLAAGRDAGARAALVSGSGPTAAFLCTDGRHAQQVARRLREAGVCRTALTASGPVPGADVVA